LADVEPADAGAASGLINVAQQVGAATGLAVLVTIFDAATHHAQLGAQVQSIDIASAQALLVHGLRVAFASGAILALAGLALVAAMVRAPSPMGADAEALDLEAAALAELWPADVG
jgi:hypothetical protein